MDDYSIIPYKPEHGEYVAANMREMDVFECRAAGFTSPLQAIKSGFEQSINMQTGCYKDMPLCVWGEAPDTAGGAVIWELGIKNVTKHKRAFIVHSKIVIEQMLSRYDYLTNVVCMDNKESVRWLTWLGAEFMDGEAIVDGKPFQRFFIWR